MTRPRRILRLVGFSLDWATGTMRTRMPRYGDPDDLDWQGGFFDLEADDGPIIDDEEPEGMACGETYEDVDQ